jgi:hypothetical protein
MSSWLGKATVAAVALVVVLAAGIVIGRATQGSDDHVPSQAGGEPQASSTSTSPITVATIASPPVASPTALLTSTPAHDLSTPPPASVPPSPTPTVDFNVQPAVQVSSVSPPLGTHVEQASVNIAINVFYQAGRDSNVLTWHILYCASPIDCNTYGGQGGVDIIPGAAGAMTLGAPFAAGGNHLRPIVICQYTVEIGHFLTPEAQWQTQLADDPRCHPPQDVPRIKVTDVTPPLGTTLNAGDTISVYVEYDAGPATRIEARYSVENCAGDLYAFRSAPVSSGTSGVTTILIPVTPSAVGPLRHIEARLMNGDTVIATYNFGPC